MHSEKVVHRDIKLENIFYDQHTGNIKVGDLGSAIYLFEINKTTM